MLRFGVIGTSWITESFIAGAEMTGNWKLTAVCSRDAAHGREFADRHNVAHVYTNVLEMALSGQLDAAYIASPNVCHTEQARIMIENGIHVLCEKPLTAHPEELETLQHLAEQRGVIFVEAILYMHLPLRQQFRAAVEKVGNIGKAYFDFCQYSSKYPAYLRGETPNIFNPAMETGALMDLGVYCVYPAVDLFGKPDRVAASADFLKTGADGSCAALLGYADKSVTLTCSKIARGMGVSEVVGDRGGVTVSSISLLGGMTVAIDGEERISFGDALPREELMSYEAADFYRYITDPTAVEEYRRCTETALAVSQVMRDIRHSAGIIFPKEEK